MSTSSNNLVQSSLYLGFKFFFLYFKCRIPDISVIMDISVLEFYGYIKNIDGYFDKNIGKAKINKNTLKFMEILC